MLIENGTLSEFVNNLRGVSDESVDERLVVRLHEAKIQTFFTGFVTNWTKGNITK